MTLPSLPPLMPPGVDNPLLQWLGAKEVEVADAVVQAEVYLAAKTFIDGARLCMDDFARQIFDLWFSGAAPDVVTFDDDRWAAYMRQEPRVIPQVTVQLEGYARGLAAAVRAGAFAGTVGRFQLVPFHVEIGSDSGGYFKGYNVLHGTDRRAGDFRVSGTFRPGPVFGAQLAYTIFFEDLAFEFCDRVDANLHWNSDRIAGRLVKEVASVLGGPPPKDFELHIKWRPEKPIVVNVGVA
jgi:hypothetical protein